MATVNGLAKRLPVQTAQTSGTRAPKFALRQNVPLTPAHDIDRRLNTTISYVKPRDLGAIRRIQEAFLERKKEATTYLWCAVAVVLMIRMIFPLPALAISAVILAACLMSWKKYRVLCQCPNCNVSLMPGHHNWRTPTPGFATSVCPRCDAQLLRPAHEKQMRI